MGAKGTLDAGELIKGQSLTTSSDLLTSFLGDKKVGVSLCNRMFLLTCMKVPFPAAVKHVSHSYPKR